MCVCVCVFVRESVCVCVREIREAGKGGQLRRETSLKWMMI